MTTWRFDRATVTTPGKHGEGDYKSEIGKLAPKLGEYALLLGGKLLAEDRYAGPRQRGRHLYLGYLKEIARAVDMDEVLRIAERTQADKGSGLPGFVRCHKGGKNDCASLCYDCWAAGFRLPEETIRSTLLWWGIAADDDIEQFMKKVRRG
jgi:hypothetical protein